MAKDAAVAAGGAIGNAAGQVAAFAAAVVVDTADAASRIVAARRSGDEPVSQVLFRVPESLRDDIKLLSVTTKRPMEELLTEAVLDLLLKYQRRPRLLEAPSIPRALPAPDRGGPE